MPRKEGDQSADTKVRKLFDETKPSSTPGPQPINVGDLLTTQTNQEKQFRELMEEMGVKYSYGKKAFWVGDDPTRTYPKHRLIELILLRGGTDFSEAALNPLLNVWIDDLEARLVAEVREELSATDREAGGAELQKLLDLICEEGAELSAVVMRQWIWQVQRKLHGLDPVGHVMPILRGKQGCGKTTIIRHLLRPLGPLTGTWDFSQITDERHWVDLERCYVGYVEELAGAKDRTLSTLKGILTADRKQVRLLNTHDRTTIQVKTSFIGDTNFTVSDIIRDSSGGRRFWEIRCLPEIDLEAVAEIDFPLIWRCVSASDPSPVAASEHFVEIQKLQDSKIRARDSVDHWLEERGHSPGEHPWPLADLFADYRTHAAQSGEMATTKVKLSKRLSALGYVKRVARVSKDTTAVCMFMAGTRPTSKS